MNRSEIIEALHRGTVAVEFIKADGSKRKMRCTLDASRLPDQPKTEATTVNEAVVKAWDIEKQGWRSFRVDSVEAWYEEIEVEGIAV